MSKGEAKIKRGFKLSHQKLVLEVDIDRQSLLGYTDITVVPHSRNLPKIKLHCRQCHVTQVSINGIDANFVRKNYLEKVVPDDEYDHDIKSFTARYKAALHASDQGDLIVELPPGVTIQESNDVGPGDGDSKLGNGESHHVIRSHNFSPLVVRVHYQLVQPRAGAYFVLPTETAYPRRVPHMYTHNQDDNGARLWMPTVDHVGERCTWELEITVAQGQIAVASGELLEQVWADDEETKKIFYYKQPVPVPARAIAIAVGPFQVYPDPHVPSITHFCLPGRLKELQHTVDFLGKAYRYYEEYLHTSFPFESYKQVFVEDAYSDVSSCGSLSIFSSHLLHDETIIDQTLVTRRLLALALAQQWFQSYVGVKSWPDMWISVGIAGYLAGLYFRRMFGNNEYRYRLMMESEWVCGADSGPPLYNEHAAHPHDMQTELVARKAPLVVYMMERRVGETSFRKLLNGLVAVKPTTSTSIESKESASARDANGIPPPATSTKESVDQTLSTKKLLKTIKLETGQDMKSFAEKWIYGKGCPKFACGFWFNRKRHQTEFALRQTNKPEDRISSELTIRINELDGSYDNVIQFDEEMHAYEFPCYSRVRKSRKKKKDGDDKEEAPVVTTAPGAKKTETPLLWVRIDPDMEWIHNITFKQPEYMWVHQLEEDRDVVAQHEAIRGLQLFATSNALSALNRVVNNALVFYRVRMEAAYSLSSPSSSTPSSDQPASADVHWIGLDHLLRTFKNLFYNPDGTQLLPNTFADFCNYHLQKILPLAMAQVQDKEGRTPSDVLEFLLDLLKNNDNSLNSFSDNYYLESVLLAVSKTNTTGLSDTDKIAKQIHRYLNMERLMPSYHNTVTVACVKALGNLQCARKLDASSQVFRDYARYGHFDEVRIAASTALARLGFTQLKDPGITDKLLTFAESDPSPRIRARILDILASPVASEERAFFDALYPSMDRLWALVNGPVSALDSRVRGAALRLHQAVLAWGKQYGVVPDMPSHIPIPQRNANPIKVRAIMGGGAGGAAASLGPGKKLLPKSKSSSKRKQEETALPSEPLKIIFKTSEGSPPTTTSHNPPSTTSTTSSSSSTSTSTPQPTTPPLSSSSSSTPAPKRRKHSSATPTAKTPQTPSPAPSPAPSPSVTSSHLPTIKEEPPTPPQPKATQPKRTPPPAAPQPLSPPPSTPSHPPPAARAPPQTPTPAPHTSSTPSTPSTPSSSSSSSSSSLSSSSSNLPPVTPSSTAPSPSPSPAPGSLKIKLKLGGVRLQDPQNKK